MASHYRSSGPRSGLAPVYLASRRAVSIGKLARVLPLIALGAGLTAAPALAQDPVYPPSSPTPPATTNGNPALPAPAEAPQYPPTAAPPTDAPQPVAPPQTDQPDTTPPQAAQPDAGQPQAAPDAQYPPAPAAGNPQTYVAPAPGDQDGQYPPAAAQNGPQYANSVPGSPAQTDATATGPVRMARFSMLDGPVSWRPDDNSAWQAATDNLPIDQGAEIAVSEDAHAEIQFDDGSFLRLAPGASAAIVTLYSDAQGEFTEIHLDRGLSTLHLTNDHSVYQVDSVNAQVNATGPATIRIGVGDVTDVAVRAGQAKVQGANGSITLNSGNYLAVAPGDAAYNIQALPEEDSWDSWNDERDAGIASAAAAVPDGALPPNIALAAPDLSTYGTWSTAPGYGSVWYPRARPGWRPYYNGSWSYVAPYGWTWVSSEPWGWAPYHYGTWIDTDNGWAWVPGPANQYWSPAVVHFSTVDDTVAWCPLAPEDVVYPSSFAVGDYGDNWSLFFSIGGCGVYLADEGGICRPHPWNWGYLHAHDWNHDNFATQGGLNPGDIQRHEFGAGLGGALVDHPFVPHNQRFGAAIVVSTSDFQNHGAYRLGGAAATTIFASGHATVLSAGRPFAGPTSIRPTGTGFAGGLGEARVTNGGLGTATTGHLNGFNSYRDPAQAAQAARGSLNYGYAGATPRTAYGTPSFYDRYAPAQSPRVQGSLYSSPGMPQSTYGSHGYTPGNYSYSAPRTGGTGFGGYANSTSSASSNHGGSSSAGSARSAAPTAPAPSQQSSSSTSNNQNSNSQNSNNQGNPNHGH